VNECSLILNRGSFVEILRNSNEFIDKIEIFLIGLHLAEFVCPKIIFSWKKLSLAFSRKWLRMFIKFYIFPGFSLGKTSLSVESNQICEENMMSFLPTERISHFVDAVSHISGVYFRDVGVHKFLPELVEWLEAV
jgi:hypothetical protein